MPYPEIIAIIPASGKGERFGMPKADAVLNGQPFIEHIQSTLQEAGVGKVFVARDYDTPDMLSTIKLAVEELSPNQALGYLIFPVDHPFVSTLTISSLCDAFLAMPDAVFRPSFNGSIGHPIVIPAWLDLAADDFGQGLAGIIRSQVCSVIDLPVDDDAVQRNVNYPKDLEL